MGKVNDVFQILQVGDIQAACLLDTAVEVDGEHALGAGGHAAGAQGVAETIVLDLVAQATAAAQGVGVVAHIGEEGVAFGVHFRGEVGVFLVFDVAVLGKQRHGLHREGEYGAGAFLVEPAHEAFLQPTYRFPVGLAAVGEAELAEQTLEIVFVVVGNVPEYGLEIARARRLVDGIDHLLETVGDHFVNGALLAGKVNHLIGIFVVVSAVFLFDEVVEVHQELGGCARAAQHAGHHEHHIDKAAAEGFQVSGFGSVAANALRAAEQPWVHGDAGAVIGDTRLIIFIDKMMIEQV